MELLIIVGFLIFLLANVFLLKLKITYLEDKIKFLELKIKNVDSELRSVGYIQISEEGKKSMMTVSDIVIKLCTAVNSILAQRDKDKENPTVH